MDLFAGAGGFSLGMAMANFHIAASIEYDKDAVATFKANHPPEGLMAFRSPIEIFPNIMLSFTRGIDVVVGGPPCQPFSEAGLQNPLDERKNLFREFVKTLRTVDSYGKYKLPSAFVFENVEGLATTRGGKDLAVIQEALADCGYFLSTRVLDTSEYGLPQRRRRLIMVGSRFPGFEFPDPVPVEERTTLRDAIGDLPPPTADGIVQVNGREVTGHTSPNHSADLVALISQIPEGGRLFDLEIEGAPKAFRGSYARLSWNRPSQTITGSFGKPSSARCIHPEQHRGLTVREAARLQGFPDGFRFHGGVGAVRMQIGNAVPPLLAYHIGTALRRHLEANGVPFQNYEAPEQKKVPRDQLPWYLVKNYDKVFEEIVRQKRSAAAEAG
ncbi:DNA cytosine methyltransferase [Neorhizobium sp. BT27B]|uniref:DNA cytosine methyltransferase n=1 Tax=Neorhizobium sp. BT27B TaxID=3142625 RepID=UPI003D26765B